MHQSVQMADAAEAPGLIVLLVDFSGPAAKTHGDDLPPHKLEAQATAA